MFQMRVCACLTQHVLRDGRTEDVTSELTSCFLGINSRCSFKNLQNKTPQVIPKQTYPSSFHFLKLGENYTTQNPPHLHHSLGPNHLQHLPTPASSVGQGQVDNLGVPGELHTQNQTGMNRRQLIGSRAFYVFKKKKNKHCASMKH